MVKVVYLDIFFVKNVDRPYHTTQCPKNTYRGTLPRRLKVLKTDFHGMASYRSEQLYDVVLRHRGPYCQ
jgi:hypothetical protein